MLHSRLAVADHAALPFVPDAMAKAEPMLLGVTLRRAREARRLTLEDVAGTTRISLRYLTALETSHFDAFVGAIYAIGFARAYARVVGLSESWAADTLRAEAGWR